MTSLERAAAEFERSLTLMRTLRSPQGCAWDREQNHSSLRKHVIEESYEVAEAIDAADPGALCDELGDLFLQVLFHAQIAQDEGSFDIADVLSGINSKLERRHPHVFGSESASTPEEVMVHWEEAKRAERDSRHQASTVSASTSVSVLDGVASALPALIRAEKLQDRAAGVGFDWPDTQGVFEKILEEADELRTEVAASPLDRERVAEELGDLMFVIVNLARHLDVHAEEALDAACSKFRSRFNEMERSASDSGGGLPGNLSDWDELWMQAKSAT